MARKLPWERKEPRLRASDSASEPPQNRLPAVRASRLAPGSTIRRSRSPSTSPARAPPPEVFMIDGLKHDDQYRMVEDELLAVARTYTAHLHAAEYQRLKTLARASQQTATGLHTQVRPLTGRTTNRVRVHTGKKRRGLQRMLAREVASEEDDKGNAPWTGTSLEALMEGSQTRHKNLLPLVSLTTTAAVRTSRQNPACPSLVPALGHTVPSSGGGDDIVKDDEDEDEDDLDGPSILAPPPATRQAKRTVSFAPQTQEFPAPVMEDDRHSARHSHDEDGSGLSEDDEDIDLDAGNLLERIRRRREQEKAQRQKDKQQRQQQRLQDQT